jgi:hypothetical protein
MAVDDVVTNGVPRPRVLSTNRMWCSAMPSPLRHVFITVSSEV